MRLIRIDVKDGKIVASSLDGHKVIREYVDAFDQEENFSCWIKPEILNIKEQYCMIELQGEYSIVTIGDYSIRCKQPEGVPYQVDDFMNHDECKTIIGFKTKLLKEAIDSISSEMIVLSIGNPKQPMYIRNVGKKLETEMVVLPVYLGYEEYNK